MQLKWVSNVQRLFLLTEVELQAHKQRKFNLTNMNRYLTPQPWTWLCSFQAPSHGEQTSLVKMSLLAVSRFIKEQTSLVKMSL